MTPVKELRFAVSARAGEVSAILIRPPKSRLLLVLAHGAGAGMRHRFMEEAATTLASRGIATFRYQFPYTEKGGKRPDPQPVLLATVRAAVAAAHAVAEDLPLLAGGKSMGGRMTSLTASEEPLPNVKGLVFFGFPLHAAGSPGSSRGDHLQNVTVPMLFLQGSRDKLADLTLLRPIALRLGARGTLHVIDDADHSFAVPKRTGRDTSAILAELAEATASWAERT